VEVLPRIVSTFVHMGEAKEIIADGFLTASKVFYHHWPGMLLVTAELLVLSGMRDILLLKILPILMSILYLIPLFLILRIFTKEKVYIFLGMIFFIVSNWIGQNHWSIQNPIYFVYLIIIYSLLKAMLTKEKLHKVHILFLSICILIIVLSHAITPYVLVCNILFLGIILRNRFLIYLSALIAGVYLFWQAFFSGFALQKVFYILTDKISDIKSFILFSEGSSRLAATSIYNTYRLILKGAIALGYALVSGSALYLLHKNGNTETKNIAKVLFALLLSVLFFGITLRFGAEILERVILFSLVPCTIAIMLAYKQHLLRAGIIIYLIVASVLFMPVFYFNESFEYVSISQLEAREYIFENFNPSEYTVMDQRILLWFYSADYTIKLAMSSSNFDLMELPSAQVYVVDQQSKAELESYYEGGSEVYTTLEDTSEYNKIYDDSSNTEVYTKNE
jgi:hypothetical protein